ncbi:cation:proton antiporter [Mycolicibacterium sp. 050158]|uniref:cation:proton antiporter n=1 Tax=Mycolicibacterium sp. 050158 TaxID=3090602 RepID=UPI00299D762D|nr:cation:proton antiporter [Mycolicibacterium sp. 050158]MDX1892076.1 cation:proton antiporter [Mycolicibacterium sp. 050158]
MPAPVAVHFFLELAVILLACRAMGMVARRFGQPQVVGEMIAGVVLGPSLLGLIAPEVQHSLFPTGPANTVLYTMAQIGLVLYMFLIGLNFDVHLIKHRAGTAAAVSSAGILVPLGLGALIAGPLIAHGSFFGDDVTLVMAMLFLGASIATTAFPMLARIIFEKRLAGTSLGTLALACGATDDALSWCILAIVLAMNRDSPGLAVMAIAGGILYALLVLTVGRRALGVLGPMSERRGAISAPMLGVVLCVLMLCAWFTDTIGIYAIFGAFILGIAMPSGFFAQRLTTTLEPLVTTFLLPLFFVYSGLNTQIGLVDTPALWALTLGLLVVSIAGKGVACTLAARLKRVPMRESVALGALMNARGLIELILLNIGLQAGIITPTLFTILVLVAIVTTLMASPIFEFVYGRHRVPDLPAGGQSPRVDIGET